MPPGGYHTGLHRNTPEGQYLYPYAIEVAVHGNVLASECFSLQDLRAADADVIAYSYRKRVQPVSGRSCQILELGAYRFKHQQQEVTEAVQASAESALIEHLRDIALHVHEVPGMIQVSSKVEHGYKGSSNDLTVTDPYSAVFPMAHGFKNVIYNTVKSYNFIFGKHR